MNAKQEILDALRSTILAVWPEGVYNHAEARIRAILETHELVPVDQHAEMQRLLLPYAGLKLRDGEVMPVDGEGIVECLTRVLQAFEALRTTCGEQWGHELDTRSFDPALTAERARAEKALELAGELFNAAGVRVPGYEYEWREWATRLKELKQWNEHLNR